MIDKFKEIDINNEKVKKIVDGAFEEFSKFGEEKASLNKILKKAGISKGVFYHYFKDKEELFDYLINYTADISINNISSIIQWDDEDLIKRICEISKYRLEISRSHNFMIKFYDKFQEKIFRNSDIESILLWKEKFYNHNIDFEKFKDKEALEESLHIIKWTYKGLFVVLLNGENEGIQEKVISDLIQKCDRYYEVLASQMYK